MKTKLFLILLFTMLIAGKIASANDPAVSVVAKTDTSRDTVIRIVDLLELEDFDPPQYHTRSRMIRIAYPKDIRSTFYVFYYSPRMEQPDYPYQMYLDSDNNFLGCLSKLYFAIDTIAPGYRGIGYKPFAIPDTIDPGAKLMFRGIGYEPFEIPIGSIADSSVSIADWIVPKIYHTGILLCKEKGDVRCSSVECEKLPGETFYGDCRPIYDKYGNHADPLCAFSSLGCVYPCLEFFSLSPKSKKEKKEWKALYRLLSKGKTCSFLVIKEKGKVKLMPEQPYLADKFPNLMHSLQPHCWIRNSMDCFSIRLTLSVKSNVIKLSRKANE